MIEVLLSLAITLLIVFNIYSLYRIIYSSQKIDSNNEDIYIAVKQISQYLYGSEFVDLNNGYTYINYENKEMTIFYDKNRLVKKDGYEIILSQIDFAEFDIEEDKIYLDIKRGEDDYRFFVGIMRLKEDDYDQENE